MRWEGWVQFKRIDHYSLVSPTRDEGGGGGVGWCDDDATVEAAAGFLDPWHSLPLTPVSTSLARPDFWSALIDCESILIGPDFIVIQQVVVLILAISTDGLVSSSSLSYLSRLLFSLIPCLMMRILFGIGSGLVGSFHKTFGSKLITQQQKRRRRCP